MSVENIDKFYALAFEDQSLIEPLKSATDEASFAEIAIKLGAANDCDFTAEEVVQWREKKLMEQANGELDDLQLEAVSGGKVSGGGIASIVVGSLAVVAAGAITVGTGGALAGPAIGLGAAGVGAIGAGAATDK